MGGLIAGHNRGYGRVFFKLWSEIDVEWVFVDRSYIRAHQHASGARIGEERAIGRSRGGPTTKLHIVADAHGNPIDFEITEGEVHDAKAAPEIILKMGEAGNFIGDKGNETNHSKKIKQ